jgi:hypothetical protein
VLSANLTVNGDVIVDLTGKFSPNGHALTTTGNFITQASGTLQMTGASDAVNVQGSAIFGGGSTAGLLTNGTLSIFGDFTQTSGTSTASFQALAPHLTQITGNFGTDNISFASPDTILTGACSLSCFGNFTIAKTAGTLAINSMASAGGNVNINAGVTAVTASQFILVHGSTTTANGTNVHVSRFGTFGAIAFAADLSTIADTIQFHGNASQTIPTGEYNEVVIKGSPTVGAGGFTADGNLTVDGGTLALGGQAVSVVGGFLTTGTGVLVMNNVLDSLLVEGQATFSGGAEAGNLTNGVLLLFQGIVVSNAGQFNATGSHLTYLFGPAGSCSCTDLIPAHGGSIAASASRSAARTQALVKALIAARRARAIAGAAAARAKSAAVLAARQALASKWTSRASAIRLAASAGKTARQPRAMQSQSAAPRTSNALANVLTNGPRIGAARPRITAGGSVRASSIVIQAYSSSPVYVNFGTGGGNQFANVRVAGQAEWQLAAAAAGDVLLDPASDVGGLGHLAVGGTLTGSSSSSIEVEAVELFGVMADTGAFMPDTTIFSGTSPMMPSKIGGIDNITYNNVVVNSTALGVPAENDAEIDVLSSLFIQNSGVLRIGVPIGSCNLCDSDELYVWGNVETHGAGALQMTDPNNPYLAVDGNALFAGGSTTGMLTQGEIDYFGNLTQSGPTTTSYTATSPHLSYFMASSGVQTISFANPSYAASHFGDLYFGDPTSTLTSNVFVDGQLQFGRVIAHTVQGTPGLRITSKGASARDILFSGISWTLLDGYPVDDMDQIEFSSQPSDSIQFNVQRSAASLGASLTFWEFDTTPTGGGLYIKATDTDGATNGFLTINMSSTSPASPGAFTSVSGGAVINGWNTFTSATWLGLTADWNSTANWSTGLVPDASTNVTVSCDCSAPMTISAAAVTHDLTITGGNQFQLGAGFPLTVHGTLTIPSGSDIIASSASVTLLGNVAMDPTASPGGIVCGAGSTGAILSGTGTQFISGKFCRLVVASNVLATGRIYVKNSVAGDAGLTIQTGGSLDLNGDAIETDSMITTGGGTFTMTHALDSLILHGASGNFAVNFIGGSETGLITNGTIVLRAPNFHASGTSFDATFNNVVVADTTVGQTFRWTGATVGHGFNNLILKNSNFDNFATTDLVVQGTLTLDASMGTSGQFAGTGASLYAGSLVDNTGNATGGFAGAYWIHLTQSGAAPAKLPVDSLFFEFGGTMQLANNVTTSAVVVVRPDVLTGSNTGLYLNGHTLKTTNRNFITTGTAFLDMQSAGDSLDVGTASVFFNGGGPTNALTNGGIAAGGFYQGYTSTSTLASGASTTSFQASGTNRVWLTGNAPVVFANPGTSGASSYFNSLHQPAGFTTKLYTDIVVGDTLYVTSGSAFSSDQPNVLGQTRFLSAAGLADFTSSNASFINVGLKFIDGQAAPAHFDHISFSQFPTGFTGNVFEIARLFGPASTVFDSHIFNAISFGVGGEYVNNTGTQSWSFTNTAGTASPSFTLTSGQKTP